MLGVVGFSFFGCGGRAGDGGGGGCVRCRIYAVAFRVWA